MYSEILCLYDFCGEHGICVELHRIFDGYLIRFFDGSDFAQHFGTYGSDRGCVEPAGIDPDMDYSAVSLEEAKQLVLKKKEYFCGKGGGSNGL